jgi:hypothetical protein
MRELDSHKKGGRRLHRARQKIKMPIGDNGMSQEQARMLT